MHQKQKIYDLMNIAVEPQEAHHFLSITQYCSDCYKEKAIEIFIDQLGSF